MRLGLVRIEPLGQRDVDIDPCGLEFHLRRAYNEPGLPRAVQRTESFVQRVIKGADASFLWEVTVFLLATTVFGQSGNSHGDVDSCYRGAWKLQQLAEGAASTGEARTNFQQAIAQCDAAVEMKQSFLGARAGSALL